MSIIQLDSRIQIKKDTEANWTSNNPVLLDGETVISLQSDGTVRKKTGNGTSNYNQLNYDDEYALNNTTQQINTHNTSSNPHANMGWVTDSDLTASNVSFTPGSTGMSATDVQGAVTELFTSVSDGKSAIAAAITDQGVTTAADATFQQMANNILDIQTGGGTPVSPSDVNFYDYDGTLLYSYTIAEVNLLTELPQPPTHDGLTFQGWNYSLESVQTATRRMDIGATYITSDGKTRLHITVPANSEPGLPPPRNQVPLYFRQTVANGVTIDWGDSSPAETLSGTGVVNTTHTYETAGDFVISLTPVDGCDLGLGTGTSANCVMGSTGMNGRVYCDMLKRVEVGSSVTSIGDYAFYDCYSLSGVVIPDSVTSIGDYAFYDCYSLSGVVIPDSVTSIGDYAFYDCYSLSGVVIPDSVTSIESHTFYYCYSLSSVVIPDSVTSIESHTFYYCHSLSSVVIPDSVTSIGDSAFGYCYSLSSVVIPDSVTSIGDSAFNNCYSLSSVVIPDGVTSIGLYAFNGCYSLSSVVIPDGVTSIGYRTFGYCCGIKEYHCKPLTPPTLSSTDAFSGLPSDCIIYVPVGSLEAYKTARDWSTYASYMQKEPA